MICKNCGSHHVVINFQSTEKPKARHGIAYWIVIGWWLHPILWAFCALPMLVWRIINPNRKTATKQKTYAVCQSCGKMWEVR